MLFGCVRIRKRLAIRDLTLDDIASALRTANANSPIGTLEGPRQTLTIQANRQLSNAAAFAKLIIATSPGGNPVRLSEVAAGRRQRGVDQDCKLGEWGAGNHTFGAAAAGRQYRGDSGCHQGCHTGTGRGADALVCSAQVDQRPFGVSIRDSIHDVKVTLGITIVLVLLVIFLFLRKASATLIPALSFPISLLGTVAVMRVLDYSLDNISLLAITLAVGLVVDDAIVVLENIVRHIERGFVAVAGRASGIKRGQFYDYFNFALARRRVYSDLFHARRNRTAFS